MEIKLPNIPVSHSKKETKLPVKKIVAVYSISPEYFACPYIRIWSPMSGSTEFDAVGGCCIGRGGLLRYSSRLAQVSDVIILQREFPSYVKATEDILEIAESRGIPVLLESDDDLVNLPDEHPAAAISAELRTNLERVAHRLSGFIVSTNHLATLFKKYDKPIYVVPNFIDDRLWQMPPLKRDPNIMIIGYMGTPTHREDLDCAIPSIKKILHKYQGKVEFWLWGDLPIPLRQTKGVRLIAGLNVNYPEFVTNFTFTRPDIAIAPLRDVPFNYSKSAIKYFEYSVSRIPGIYSKVGPYAHAVENGKTGLLVENSESAWTNALESLLQDPSLRNRIGGTARITVMRDHSLANKGSTLSDKLLEIVNNSKSNN